MKNFIKRAIITFTLLFVSASLLIYLSPKPDLQKGLSYSTTLYDHDHHLLRLNLSQDDKFRLYTPLKDISPYVIEATLLQEDRYFYHHFGINPWSIIKAGWTTYFLKKRRVGASTITMQVAKLRFHSQTHKILGKIKQIITAIQIERHYTKDQILESYLNLAPYGNNIEGIGAAALILYQKPAKNIAKTEAITLAVIPQNPIKRKNNFDQLNKARKHLFEKWIKKHAEDKNQIAIMRLPIQFSSLNMLPFIAPHFVQYVSAHQKNQQEIKTTLDKNLQEIFSNITTQYLKQHHFKGINNAAVLLIDARTMGTVVEIGSGNFYDRNISGQINGTRIKRSTGSTLKPFIYALALDQGLIHPATLVKDVPQSFGNYNPENFDYRFRGPLRATDALILSRNIPAVSLMNQLKNPGLYDLLLNAEIKDLKSQSHYGLSLALGSAELTMHELASLYAMLANNGLWKPIQLEAASTIFHKKQLLSPEAAYLILTMLKQTPPPFKHPLPPIAYKTGTSSRYRDAWTAGINGPYVLVVWLGNFNQKSNHALIGKEIAAPLFFQLMLALAHHRKDFSEITTANKRNITEVEICSASGLLPTPYCHDREKTLFIPGKSPIKSDTIFREVAINPKTGKRVCHIDKETQYSIYEFWPSDILTLFKRAGISRKTPPAYEKSCMKLSNFTLSPRITTPQSGIQYIKKSSENTITIPLSAICDGDVKMLFWFANNHLIGNAHPDTPLFWKAVNGQFTLRVVDDHGMSDNIKVEIKSA